MVNDIKYKVCITAAGQAKRNTYSEGTNKALLPINNRAVISHMITKFNEDIEFVIALGHESEQVRSYLKLAWPKRKFVFVNVDKFSGIGSGPGHSLLCCKDVLQCPFILISSDTIVKEDIPIPDSNWVGIAPVNNIDSFLVLDVDKEKNVKAFFDKKSKKFIESKGKDYSSISNSAFIGLAGIYDYKSLWEGLSEDGQLINGEKQISNGLENIQKKGLKAFQFTWFDTGTDKTYEMAYMKLNKSKLLSKPEESIFFENGTVIKYFRNKNRLNELVKRSKYLEKYVPKVIDSSNNFLAYRYINGRIISDYHDPIIFKNFLDFMFRSIWSKINISESKQKYFRDALKKFYIDKTLSRINQYYEKRGYVDKAQIINGKKIPKLIDLINAIPLDNILNGTPVLFHGDPQPENILVDEKGNFILLDWRQNFGGILEFGDLYYDLGKIHHALILSQKIIRHEQYAINIDSEQKTVNYSFDIRLNLLRFLNVFESFIIEKKWSLSKTRMMSALIWLNIAALHHSPYDDLLFHHGKAALNEILEGEWSI